MLDVLFLWALILLGVAHDMVCRRSNPLYQWRGHLVFVLALFLVSPLGPLHDAPKEAKAAVVCWSAAFFFSRQQHDEQEREEEAAVKARLSYEEELETRIDKLEKRAARKRRSRSPARRSHSSRERVR